ncbi:MAG: DUF2167 domain-containing protein [Flavobacteriales bacterium]|nr:DUF2167 domain-containing protein [Flavobacteriales bacterium]
MSIAATILLATRIAFPIELGTEGDTTALDTAGLNIDAMVEEFQDSAAMVFTYHHGTVQLEGGVASLALPEGFKFLDKEQSARVIVDLWGNPDADGILGIIFPEKDDVFSDSTYAYVVQYDEIGYVKDDDADDIDYDELIGQLREGEEENNKLRATNGYEPMYLIGWAAKPFYDKERKVLHWAKEIKFGDSAEVNTLNYNVRVLGRKGVLVLNAVAGMGELELVKQHVPEVLNVVQFNEGFKYEQFDSKVDDVAAWTIGGLVAGKVLAKVGIFAVVGKLLLKFWYVIVLAFGGLIKLITGRKKKDNDLPPPATYTP